MIIYHYLSKQLFRATASVTAILLMIFVGGRFIKYMAEAAQGRLAGEVLLLIMAYRLPSFLELILPLGIFVGILLAYGRLYLDSEMTVLSASGVSHWQIVGYTLIPTFCLMSVVALLTFWGSPWGTDKYERIIYEQRHQSGFETLSPGRFHSSKDKSRVTYAENLSDDEKRMENIFMAQGRGDEHVMITAASGARRIDPATGIQYLDLFDGYRYEGRIGHADHQVVKFQRSTVKLADAEVVKEVKKIKAAATSTLFEREDPAAQSELQWRFSLPILVPIVVLLAVPLSKVNPRQGRYGKVLPSIMLYLIYVWLLSACKAKVADGELPATIGLWWVHVLFFIIAIGLNSWEQLKLLMVSAFYKGSKA